MRPSDAAPVLPGETLSGKYRIERILGRGGMGIVVAARHLDLDERVAIKCLLRKDDPAAVARFVREARAAAKVKSEHVCRVHDVGRLESGEPYMVMEYLEGSDLGRELATSGPVSVAVAARWIVEACAGLAAAHAIGIVHRDLKPANLFLARQAGHPARVKILDFGISKLPLADPLTATTATVGTPSYMSPEQVASARDVDARTDVWSLGVILHELVSGEPPFQADSLIQLSVKIREAERRPLADVSDAFDAIVAKCLAKDRACRFQTAGELASALAPFAGSERATLDPLSRGSIAPTRRRRAPALAFVVVGTIGVVAAARAVSRAQETAAPTAPVTTATAPPEVAASASPPPIAPTVEPDAAAPRTIAPAPRARPRATERSVDAGPATAPPVEPARKKRPIDRSDPYAH